ncbi:MAG TPA: LLM class F420-dependent oxidoreductase [Acidimicrobiales bacterium]|nr:LLM class F420-dependent oxidoreductase [Acidimicrobiales bacterium]
MELGRVGIWWSGSWRGPEGADAAAEMESLGYGALWASGGYEPGLARWFTRLLETTSRVAVLSGIVSIWCNEPGPLAAEATDLDERFPGRFNLGLGASHAALVEPSGQPYVRPLSRLAAFLDALDALDAPALSPARRLLAALGPRMLELAARRSAGAHPYFVPVEHTAVARERLGSGPLLAPELAVVLERDPQTAREIARRYTAGYLSLPNYANNLRRLGFGEDDLAGGGTDRLVDAVVAWGDDAAIAARVAEHHAAGADHVCVQVLVDDLRAFPLAQYRALAPALVG